MRRFVRGIALLCALPPLAFVRAEELPTLSVRELVIRADAIVLAEPLDPANIQRFKVVELLKGNGLQKGDDFDLVDLAPHDPRLPASDVQPAGRIRGKGQPELCRVSQALLFLRPRKGNADKPQFTPVLSGRRFLTTEGKLLVPRQPMNPGGYVLTLEPDCDWTALLRQTRADVAAVERVLSLQKLSDPHRRNRRLLEWVEQHRHEFGSERPDQGWGDLETDVFDWILASGIAEDCWSAVRLYAELNHGAVPPVKGPAFGSRDGREFLLRIVVNEKALTGERTRALYLLADRMVPGAGMMPLTGEEVASLLDRILPLLAEKDESFRAAAARASQRLAEEVGRDTDKKRALEALVQAYQAEKPGSVRDQLAEAVCRLGGPERWQQLTGNPAGVLVLVRDLARGEKKVTFWLGMPAGQMTVTERPTLVLERLNKEGMPMEKKALPLPTTYLPRPWNEGWDGGSYLPVEFPIEKFNAGTWRVGVEGTGKKDQEALKWTAEPKTFVVEAPKNPTPNSGGLLDKIKGLFK
jgi:hypothetical protein